MTKTLKSDKVEKILSLCKEISLPNFFVEIFERTIENRDYTEVFLDQIIQVLDREKNIIKK